MFGVRKRLRHRVRVTLVSTLTSSLILAVVLVVTMFVLRQSSIQTAQRILGTANRVVRHQLTWLSPAGVVDRLTHRNRLLTIGVYTADGTLLASGGKFKVSPLSEITVPSGTVYQLDKGGKSSKGDEPRDFDGGPPPPPPNGGGNHGPSVNGGPGGGPPGGEPSGRPGSQSHPYFHDESQPTVFVAIDWTDRFAELERVDWALIVLWPFLTAIMAFVTDRAVKSSFVPLEQLLKQVKELRMEDRLDSSDPFEFGQLANSFNAYLDTIQTVVKQQEEFAVDAAHELRTPLTALRGELELAMLQRRDPEKYVETAKKAISQVARLQRLIDSLLLATRPQNGECLHTPVEPLLEASQARWLDRYAEHRVGLELRIEPFNANMPEEEIDCILDNLLANALKFSPANTRVELVLHENGQLVVQDEGPGIPVNDRERVFERFERGANEGRGFGIGLYLARRLLQRRSGEIHIGDSVRGTRVEVHFPQTAA